MAFTMHWAYSQNIDKLSGKHFFLIEKCKWFLECHMVFLGSKDFMGVKKRSFPSSRKHNLISCGAKFSALESCSFFSVESFGFWIWMEIQELEVSVDKKVRDKDLFPNDSYWYQQVSREEKSI